MAILTMCCRWCERTFQSRRQGHVFCSRACFCMARQQSPAERFWGHVKKSNGCWVWTGGVTSGGYGMLHVSGTRRENNVVSAAAHRFSWELHNGPIPSAMFVCHKCDNHRCVKPAHLFLGDAAANMADKVAKGRSPHGEGHWRHKLKAHDIAVIRNAPMKYGARTELAKRFDVSTTTIWVIRKRRTWTCIK